MKKLFLFLLLSVFTINSQVASKITILIPNENVEEDSSLIDDNDLSVRLWCSLMSSPKIFTAFMQITCNDSIYLEFTSPRVMTKKNMQPFDAVSISAIDTATGVTSKIESIPESGDGATCWLSAGSYKLQFLYFLDYHPKLKGTIGKTQLDLGWIVFKGEEILLDSIDVVKTKDKKRKSERYPDGSRIR